jgi:nucleoside phosphorylase
VPSLLLAAFPPEFAEFNENPPAGWALACTGVGAVAAAASAMKSLLELRPDRALFLGTCGAYDDCARLGEIIAVREVIAASLDEAEGRAYRPDIERTRWTADWSLPFPAHSVLVPPAITQTQAGALRLAAYAAVEHLELSGVFEACHLAGVPAAAALVVVNRVGPHAHGEWAANHELGSRNLVRAVRNQLAQPS